jgi:uncharacterized tellurite resistance protein B-like protein
MIDFLKKVFGAEEELFADEKGNLRPHDVRVAVAVLFLEMANIDGEFSKDEQELILSILTEEFDLSGEYAAEIAEAAEEELKNHLDLWQFTNLINLNFSLEEKIRVVELLWRIIHSDGKLDRHEDYLVHKISRLFNLKHSQLIEAKLRVLEEQKKKERE